MYILVHNFTIDENDYNAICNKVDMLEYDDAHDFIRKAVTQALKANSGQFLGEKRAENSDEDVNN